MWSSRLFWKLFVAYTTLSLAALFVLWFVLTGWHKQRVTEQMLCGLRNSAFLLRSDVVELLPKGRTAAIQRRVRVLGTATETRFTLVDMDGLVLADSEKDGVEDVALMENHRTRPELLQAAEYEIGQSQRVSPTLGIAMQYFALRADLDGRPVGLIRTSAPLTVIDREVSDIPRLIGVLVIPAAAAILTLTYWVVSRIIHPVQKLTLAAEAVTEGSYEFDINIHSRDELGILATVFQQMGKQMAQRVSELRETGQRLATVLGGMAEGVIAVDDRQEVLFANAAAGELLSFDPSATTNCRFTELVRHERLHQLAADCLAQKQPKEIEMELMGMADRTISARATRLPGNPCPGILLVLRDVTELRRLESMRQEFVANVSHELKTPLSSIKAFAETLRCGAIHDPENNLRFVQRIEEQSDRLDQLIHDMLSLAQIEAGKQAFEITDVSVSEIVSECLANRHDLAQKKNIELICPDNQPPLSVSADREGLRQILDNLLDNAIKYTPELGTVQVRWRANTEHRMALIEVQDTGIGIAEEVQPRLFERFFRVDRARSRELGGTGLGLSIVKHLTQFFGGSVGVRSEPGTGSTFVVSLPLVSARNRKPSAQ